jgi:outer membrane lipoprotein-sorting protein
MKKFLFILAAIFCCTSINATGTADTILKLAAKKFNSAKVINVIYTASGDKNKIMGSMTVSGKKFYLDAQSVKTWFDGTTQWTYSAATQETNVSEPTVDEIMETNPFAIINNYGNYYKSKLLKSAKGTYKIELEPKNNDMSFSNATIVLDNKTLMPKTINIVMDNGKAVNVTVDNLTIGETVPSAQIFKYDSTKFPKAKVVDLR